MPLLSQLLALPLLLLLGAAVALFIRAKRHSLKFLQGPPSSSLLFGHEWDMSRKRVVGGLETPWFDTYGPAFRLSGGFGADILMLSDPRALQHVLHKSAYRYKKPGDTEHVFKKIFGNGVLTVNGEAHQRQRKLLNPAFSAGQIRPFAQAFHVAAQSLTQKWKEEIENGATLVDAVPWFNDMALDSLGATMLEYDFSGTQGKEKTEVRDTIRDLFLDTRSPSEYQLLRGISNRFVPRAFKSLLDLRKTNEDRRFAHWLAKSQGIARELAENKIRSNAADKEGNDFLSIVARSMEAQDPKKRMAPGEALSQIGTIIFAGHETTAFTMSWVMYELSRHPKDQEKLFQEIKQMREQSGNNGGFMAKELENMVFLNAVIREAMRLHPIFIELVRESVVDDVIPLEYPIVGAMGSVLREIPITKGQRVVASVANYNRFKEVWGHDADHWRPERFLNTKPTTLGIIGNLLTFGAGVRGCIGWRFALLEIQTVVAALIESFTFELAEGVEIDPIRLGAVSPLVKGDWNAGARLPLKIASRQV